MRLQPQAYTSGPIGMPMHVTGIADQLPRDTGEWMAVLGSATGARAQGLPLPQDELLDRISFQVARKDIENRLSEIVAAPIGQLTKRSSEILQGEFAGLEQSFGFESATRQCFVRARLTIASDSGPDVLYDRYQRIVAEVAEARRLAGFDNLEVDIVIG